MVCRAELAITCILNQLTQHQTLWEASSKGCSQVYPRDGKLSTPQVTTSLRKIGWQRFQTGATRGWWRKRTLRGMVSYTLELQTRWVLLEMLAQCDGLVSSLLNVYVILLDAFIYSYAAMLYLSFLLFLLYNLHHVSLETAPVPAASGGFITIGFSEYSGPFILCTQEIQSFRWCASDLLHGSLSNSHFFIAYLMAVLHIHLQVHSVYTCACVRAREYLRACVWV